MTDDDGMRRGAALMASGTAVSRVLGLLRGMVLVARSARPARPPTRSRWPTSCRTSSTCCSPAACSTRSSCRRSSAPTSARPARSTSTGCSPSASSALAGATVVLTLAAPLLVSLYSNFGNPAQDALGDDVRLLVHPAAVLLRRCTRCSGRCSTRAGRSGRTCGRPWSTTSSRSSGFGVFIAVFGARQDLRRAPTPRLVDARADRAAGRRRDARRRRPGRSCCIPALRRAGVHYRPRWGLRGVGPGPRRAAWRTWTFVGLAVGQLGYLVVSRVASAAPAAAVADGRPRAPWPATRPTTSPSSSSCCRTRW